MAEENSSEVSKPSWPEVMGPKKLSHRHKYMAHLAALGKSNRAIAQAMGLTDSRVSIIINSPIVREEIDRVRAELFESEEEKRTKLMIPKAMGIVEEVLNNSQERSSLRVDTAFRLMDRVYGKPKQHIQQDGTTIKDLFELLNSMKPKESGSQEDEKKVIEVQSEIETKEISGLPLETEESSLEDSDITSFLEENIDGKE